MIDLWPFGLPAACLTGGQTELAAEHVITSVPSGRPTEIQNKSTTRYNRSTSHRWSEKREVNMASQHTKKANFMPKPQWLKAPLMSPDLGMQVKELLKQQKLNSVCQEAACPNCGECFNKGTATFLIMGQQCTRNCRFCNITHGRPEPLDPDEPLHLLQSVAVMNLNHVVITSVTRDDLPDGGAAHFAACIRLLKSELDPAPTVEVLIPDLQGDVDALKIVLDANLEILNHNIETVPRLYESVRPQAIYQRSLDVLKNTKAMRPDILTKSGIMVGLGETEADVITTLKDLRAHDCDLLTIGQYLAPTEEHHPLVEYVTPEQFDRYRDVALKLGFKGVASGPLVRSSYRADKLYQQAKEI
ncbi:MAG TPA: lipoyl synthase [Clostridiaceae bacterium]|nr:lipoyl synthase [Clostridiaceae bacterium]